MNGIKVAIDGPSGAGKSSISKEAAKTLSFIYIDTGAMYRALGLCALEQGIEIKEENPRITALLEQVDMEIIHTVQGQRVFVNGCDVTDKIRTPQVSIAASDISKIPAVRIKMVALQRKIAEGKNVIMDGRDIGTYVFPDAQIKIFLTASPEERAKRRHLELTQKGEKVSYNEVLEDIKYRDENDSKREMAPLKPAEDAIIVDTTEFDFSQSAERITNLIRERLKNVL